MISVGSKEPDLLLHPRRKATSNFARRKGNGDKLRQAARREAMYRFARRREATSDFNK